MMTLDRIKEPLLAIIHDEMPGLGYLGLWEYAVTSVNADGSVNGETTGSIEVPALNSIPVGALVSGGVSSPVVGSTFLVEFRNIDGARYAFVSVDPIVQTSTLDASGAVNLGPTASAGVVLAGGTNGVARSGDQCQVQWPMGLLNGNVVVGSTTTVVVNTPIYFLTPVPALITYGNEEILA